MSAEQKEQKVVQIIGLQSLQMEMLQTTNKETVFTIKHGALAIQIDEVKAQFVCEHLADWLGLEVVGKQKLRLLKNRANLHSTKQHPLGA